MARAIHPAAKLPFRSTVKEDGLPFERAMRSLEDAGKSLKQFSKTASVIGDRQLSESVGSAREKLKKVRKAAQAVSAQWMEKAAY